MNNPFSFLTNILWNEYLRFNLELNIESSINFMFFKVSFEKYPNNYVETCTDLIESSLENGDI